MKALIALGIVTYFLMAAVLIAWNKKANRK